MEKWSCRKRVFELTTVDLETIGKYIEQTDMTPSDLFKLMDLAAETANAHILLMIMNSYNEEEANE